jgi:hypothetical protein
MAAERCFDFSSTAEFESDVVITPERVVDTWWRKQGHSVAVADLAEVVAARPDITE